MAEYVLKYADSRGEIHQEVVEAASEQELRERFTQQGFLVYSVRPRGGVATLGRQVMRRRRKLNLEKFLIFNQQFLTLIRAGLPILKALDLLGERLTDARLGAYIKAVRDEVRNGALLSEAFRRQGVFPPVYVTSILAGEKSGSLAEVLDRYIAYQKLALAVRKKLLVSLLYPALLVLLVIGLVVFLVTYVVPNFAQLYSTMSAELPTVTRYLIAVATTARSYVLAFAAALAVALVVFRIWSRTAAAQEKLDRITLALPVAGDLWVKYQVAQFARVLSTLLLGGIPLVQALETAADALGSGLLRTALEKAKKMVKEGQPLSVGLASTAVFPSLSIDMMEVGESTGALPSMLASVAEFYEDDVTIRMTAVLSLVEPAIMIFMGLFVAFVLVALYLPIFSLADTLR
ncbi:MAG: type II secretion system F family protein [Bryobacterales bacterium]|nr:type II secretion system F family protein [Bryobacteraceae bacterium]MDW8355169.1 type II secretion system F family protein [Bryobacterales bacterium]